MKEDDIYPASLLPGALLPSRTISPHHILMVDDDRSIREFCAEALVGSGYRVKAAKDGAEAWEILQVKAFNLLITDHSMPKVSGFELLQRLHGARMALPVIMATGTLPKAKLMQHPWLQPDATLLKPYSIAQLLGTVKEVLRATRGVSEWIAPPQDWQGRPSTSILKA